MSYTLTYTVILHFVYDTLALSAIAANYDLVLSRWAPNLFGLPWEAEPGDAANRFSALSVIRVYDHAGNVIGTHDHAGDFKQWRA